MRLLGFIISLVLLSSFVRAQVLINEGMNRNFSILADEDGEYNDWIELYNAGTSTVDLNGYTLTDDSTNVQKWTVPSYTLASGEHKIVFCSGKDRTPNYDHVELLGSSSTSYKYLIPDSSTDNEWMTTAFDDQSWNTAANSIGYGDLDDSLVVADSTMSIYTRYNFNVVDASVVKQLTLWVDYDDAFVAYLNGVEIIRSSNIVGIPAWNTLANVEHEALLYQNLSPEYFLLDTTLIQTLLVNGNNVLSIEVHNTDVSSDDMTLSVYLTAGIASTQYNYSPLPTWISGSAQTPLHTNFKLSQNGENVFLYDTNQVLMNQLFVGGMQLDQSVGSFPDGANNHMFFETPTPLATNANGLSTYAGVPQSNISSGFYTSNQLVNMSYGGTFGTYTIRYTTDGSDPTSSSTVYFLLPVFVNQPTVIKARVFEQNKLPGEIVTETYFINTSHTTPILSVVTDPANLYGANGIFDLWWMDIDKPCYVQYFDSTQQIIFSQRSGIQVDGGAGGSRSQPQHSFRLEFDNTLLGDGDINYAFIPTKPNHTSYSKIYLRNGSNQYLVLPYKDAAEVACMGTNTNNYYSGWRPISVYVNGQYFGLYELREKFDVDFFVAEDQCDPASVELLSQSFWYGSVLRAIKGSVDTFNSDYNKFLLLDPQDNNYWNKADSIFDLTYYTDYIVAESWIANVDWPYNNIKIYRSNKTNHRWRFGLQDLEWSFFPNPWTDCTFDHIAFMQNYDPSNPYLHIWQRLMENSRYHDYFINRFADVMNSAYHPDSLVEIEENIYQQTLSEMTNHYTRWWDPNDLPNELASYTNNHLLLQQQLTDRSAYARDHIRDDFGLPKKLPLTMNVFPAGAGYISISTLQPSVYPWLGIYYDGVPIKIEAHANPGYHFDHWDANNLITNLLDSTFLDTLVTNSAHFNAYFLSDINVVSSVTNDLHWSVYPQPTDNLLNVYDSQLTSGSVRIVIYDLQGKLVSESSQHVTQQHISIPTDKLSEGMYLLEIDGDVNRHYRFTVMR